MVMATIQCHQTQCSHTQHKRSAATHTAHTPARTQSLHPVLPSLRPYTTRRAQSLVAASLTISGALVYTIAM